MYEHVKTGCKHIPHSEQPLQFQSGYFLNKPRIRLWQKASIVRNILLNIDLQHPDTTQMCDSSTDSYVSYILSSSKRVISTSKIKKYL